MEFTKTERGKLKLLFNGYMYVKQIVKKTNIRWRCTLFNHGCKGTLVTDLKNQNPDPRADHNHAPDMSAVEVAKCRASMKERAVTSSDKPCAIYNEGLAPLSNQSKALLQKPDTCKRSIRRQRTKQFPDQPNSLEELRVDYPWTHTTGQNPKPFLFFDNQSRDIRIMAFATDDNLRLLAQSTTWYMDGNFAMAPSLFLQLYVIHVPLGDNTVPVVYTFLQRKTQDIYEELLQAIIDRCRTIGVEPDPTCIVIDFEISAKNALHAVLGADLDVHCCFYHLTQSTWRKIQELGLVDHYREDDDFRHFCGMLDGLAFLPTDRVQEGMQYLRTIVPDEADQLLAYFDATYVSGRHRQVQAPRGAIRIRRTPPQFPPASWNVHSITLEGHPRTNNVCEGWNNKYRNLVGHQHPSIWKSIHTLQGEQNAVQTTVMQHLSGQLPCKRVRRATRVLQERLTLLCNDFAAGRRTLTELLRGVGHSIRF